MRPIPGGGALEDGDTPTGIPNPMSGSLENMKFRFLSEPSGKYPGVLL